MSTILSIKYKFCEVLKMRNSEVKDYIKSKGVAMWRVAERLGITDSSFSRMLRYEITEDKKMEIKRIADELSAE